MVFIIATVVIFAVIVFQGVRVYGKAYAKNVEKSLRNSIEDFGLLACTPEQVFEHNFKVLLQDDTKEEAARYLEHWITQGILEGKEPRKIDMERLRDLGYLTAVSADGLELFPEAAYELDQGRRKIFFKKDLALSGSKDYNNEIGEVLINILDRKHCLPSEIEFLRARGRLSESTAKLGNPPYGGPGLPYPDERYWVYHKFDGEWLDFYFDENFVLVVVIDRNNQKDRIVWERPGSRQPELYQ